MNTTDLKIIDSITLKRDLNEKFQEVLDIKSELEYRGWEVDLDCESIYVNGREPPAYLPNVRVYRDAREYL